MEFKPGDKILFTDNYMSPEGYSLGKEYYRGTIKTLLNRDIVSVIFTEMSFNGKDFFPTGNAYTTTNIKDIVGVI